MATSPPVYQRSPDSVETESSCSSVSRSHFIRLQYYSIIKQTLITMKILFVVVSTLFMAVSLSAQTTHTTKSTAMYVCTKVGCPLCSHTPGACAHHKTALVLEGRYYCPMHPETTSDTNATCSTCKMAMVKMEVKTKKREMK